MKLLLLLIFYYALSALGQATIHVISGTAHHTSQPSATCTTFAGGPNGAESQQTAGMILLDPCGDDNDAGATNTTTRNDPVIPTESSRATTLYPADKPVTILGLNALVWAFPLFGWLE
ncbi:hypothetical protein BJY01DRAFT_244658 [Aspergillus pseudoustus]|uniref:Uncharacterized protein n=1 Tax=Aspergillus pseudoustus TaxID=1810923 RepID=A0ABR4KII0_9EURO